MKSSKGQLLISSITIKLQLLLSPKISITIKLQLLSKTVINYNQLQLQLDPTLLHTTSVKSDAKEN